MLNYSCFNIVNRKKKGLTSEKGVTLITLIVMIIIMLILLGVGTKIIIDGKIIGATEKTVNATNNKIGQEQIRVDYLMGELDEANENQRTEAVCGKRTRKTLPYYSDNKTAVIPEGFTVSGILGEQSIDGGLVIYNIPQNITNIDWEEDINKNECPDVKETYDQFVWIPVPNINEMFMCQSEGTDTNGNKVVDDNEYNSCNIIVTEESAKCITHNSTLMAGRIYKTSTEDYNREFKQQKFIQNREPVSTSDKTTDLAQISAILNTETGYNTSSEFNNTLQLEYNEIVKSIYNNKGFWVGRYETSGMENTNTNVTVKIVAGAMETLKDVNWYRGYAEQKMYSSNNNFNSVKSYMILGAAWDHMLDFVNTEEYVVTEVGNATHDHSGYKVTGGIGIPNFKDVSKNIYDLEGNTSEWTTLGGTLWYRDVRGGNWSSDAKSAAGRRGWEAWYGHSSRIILYVNK